MTAPARAWAAELLYVWFHHLRPGDWFAATPDTNDMLRRRFGRELTMLGARPAHEFLDGPPTALAAVLLFDQIPRNLHGTSARAFAFDPLSRAITHAALARGWERHLRHAQRQFLLMPLMHSEEMADQRLSLAQFVQLPRRFGGAYAQSHYRAVARFGRFPHRNAALGRTSTPAELRAVANGLSW